MDTAGATFINVLFNTHKYEKNDRNYLAEIRQDAAIKSFDTFGSKNVAEKSNGMSLLMWQDKISASLWLKFGSDQS